MTIRRTYLGQQPGGYGWAHVQKTFGGTFPVRTTDLVTGNGVAFCIVPPDFVVTSVYGTIPKMDNGTALILQLGDNQTPNRFLAASTLGQAGGAIPNLFGQFSWKYPGVIQGVHNEILLSFTTGAATPVAGSPTIFIDGFLGP